MRRVGRGDEERRGGGEERGGEEREGGDGRKQGRGKKGEGKKTELFIKKKRRLADWGTAGTLTCLNTSPYNLV